MSGKTRLDPILTLLRLLDVKLGCTPLPPIPLIGASNGGIGKPESQSTSEARRQSAGRRTTWFVRPPPHVDRRTRLVSGCRGGVRQRNFAVLSGYVVFP